MTKQQVIGFEGVLERDTQSNAIVNVDTAGFGSFVARKREKELLEKRLQEMETRVLRLEQLL